MLFWVWWDLFVKSSNTSINQSANNLCRKSLSFFELFWGGIIAQIWNEKQPFFCIFFPSQPDIFPLNIKYPMQLAIFESLDFRPATYRFLSKTDCANSRTHLNLQMNKHGTFWNRWKLPWPKVCWVRKRTRRVKQMHNNKWLYC